MAADIFSRATDAYGGSFSADGATVAFTEGLGVQAVAGTAVGLLVQNMTVGYQQSVLRIYEIGSNFHFLVAGRTQGQAGLARVLGPRKVSVAFYAKFGDVCNAATNIIDLAFKANCRFNQPGSSTMRLQARYCVINSIGVSMNSQDSLISENLSLMFCSLMVAVK
jgi:hypothetical protein